MSKMGHVLVVPEQVIVVCNGCMIHNMKPLDVGYMLKPKKPKNPKVQIVPIPFGLKSSKPAIVSLDMPHF